MNVKKIYGIKNWAAIAGDKNRGSEDKFLGESDSDDEYICCESSYNNPQSEESIQITEEKEPDANCLGTQAKFTFLHKMRDVPLPDQEEKLL